MTGKITTDFLHKRFNNYQIKIITEDLLKSIDLYILEKHRSGLSETIYELPENFSIHNMERCDAQLVIYSKIIEEYEERGFNVKIKLRDDGSFLLIKWHTDLDQDEKKRMIKIIKNHSM